MRNKSPNQQGFRAIHGAEGVFLALQPPSRKPATIALLQDLMKQSKN
jgi:hypothetical protein